MPKLIESKLLDKVLNFFGGGSSTTNKQKFLDTVIKSKSKILISGYECDLYKN